MSLSPVVSGGVDHRIFEYCLKYAAATSPHHEAFTVVDEHIICTVAHSRQWQIGDEVTIHLSNMNEVSVTVFGVDNRLDVVWLHSTELLCDRQPETGLPSEGMSYFTIGFSGRQLVDIPRTLNHGFICSTKVTLNGYVLGNSGAAPGDSGGPVFRAATGYLLGMVVRCENAPVQTDRTGEQFVGQGVRTFIVPISTLLNFPPRA